MFSRPLTPERIRQGFRAVIIGAPGVGKGYISQKIIKKYGCKYIATGNILRHHIKHKTQLGKQAIGHLQRGELVPNDLLTQIINKEIASETDENFLVDGYPRTVEQAENLAQMTLLDFVIHLDIPSLAIYKRIRSRVVHLPSGRTYNLVDKPPKVPGRDDVTGEPLVRRPDDAPEIWYRRMKNFYLKMTPVIHYYDNTYLLKTFYVRKHENMWPMVSKYLRSRWFNKKRRRLGYGTNK